MTRHIEEAEALARLRQGDEGALDWFIRRYTAYVGSIVWAVAADRLTAQDKEELTADVFCELWRRRDRPLPGKVKAYLGAIARTRTINRLQQTAPEAPLEYDELVLAADAPEKEVLLRESTARLRRYIGQMSPPDREIFLRYYYLCQSAPAIAARLGMTPEAVRQRLTRGRERLRQQFEEDMT